MAKIKNSKKIFKKAMAMLLGATLAVSPVAGVFAQEAEATEVSPIVEKKASIEPKAVRVWLDRITDWDPNDVPNDEINRGSIPLKPRTKTSPINDYASSEGEILSLAYLIGNNYAKYSSVGDYEFNVNTFDRWQYVGTQVFWDGIVPTPDVIDAAHKNGVPILGTLFFNWSTDSAANTVFNKFITKDEEGKYPAARKLAEIAKHYGFDGYFFNQETTGWATRGKSEALRDFILEMKEHGKKIGQPLIISFYDAMSNSGTRSHENAISSTNDIWMKKMPDGRIPVDQFFANFNWYTNHINRSKTHMESIDRSPFDFYAGFELQKDISYSKAGNRPALLGDDNKLKVSIGLFIPDTINGQAKTEEDLHDVINKFWTGENRDPSRINDSTQVYNGMGARYVVDTTTILEPKFYTSFNTGHGRHWFKEGVKTVTQDWNSRSVQDVLPTWTWWTTTDKGQKLNGYYDFSDAYNGGSSVKIYGNIEEWSYHNVNLFATKFVPQSDTFIDITYKGGNGASLDLTLNTDPNYAEQGVREFRLNPSNEGEWTTERINLSELAGQTIYKIGLKVQNTSGDKYYQLNLGELEIGSHDSVLSAPSNFRVIDKAIKTGTNAEVIVGFDRVDGAYRYDVYKETKNGEEWLFSSSSNNVFIPDLSRSQYSTGQIQNLKVYAVGENGKYSEPTTLEFDWGFAAIETTQAKDKYRNITPEARLVSNDNDSKAKAINDTLVDLTDKWWNPGPDNIVIEFDEPRTVKRWVIEHAGHAGESYNDGAMNAKNYDLEIWDEDNKQWLPVDEVRNNIMHVDDRVLSQPVTAKRWRLNVITVDNGTPWGGLRLYNWKMYEEVETESENIPMTSADTVHLEGNKYAVRFNKEKLSRFYRQNMSDFTIRIYRDGSATDLIAEKTFDENGHAVFMDVELEGKEGTIFYRTQEKGKEESNILAVSYTNPGEVEEQVTEASNKEKLQQYVNNADELLDIYKKVATQEEIERVVENLEAAKDVLNSDTASQFIVDKVLQNLRTAFESSLNTPEKVEPKPQTPSKPVEEVKKYDLLLFIQGIEGDLESFKLMVGESPATKLLEDTIAKAHEVVDDEFATQAEVDRMERIVRRAYDILIEGDEVPEVLEDPNPELYTPAPEETDTEEGTTTEEKPVDTTPLQELVEKAKEKLAKGLTDETKGTVEEALEAAKVELQKESITEQEFYPAFKNLIVSLLNSVPNPVEETPEEPRDEEVDPVIDNPEEDSGKEEKEATVQEVDGIKIVSREVNKSLADVHADLVRFKDYNFSVFDIKALNLQDVVLEELENPVKVELALERLGLTEEQVSNLLIFNNHKGELLQIQEFAVEGTNLVFENDKFSDFAFILATNSSPDNTTPEDTTDTPSENDGFTPPSETPGDTVTENTGTQNPTDTGTKPGSKDTSETKQEVNKDKTTTTVTTNKKVISKDADANPKTSDAGVAMSVLMLFAAASSFVLVRKKKD